MSKDFSRQNLRGKSFKGQNLTEANFSGTDIRGANFKNAILVGANFSQARTGLAYPSAIIKTIVSFTFGGSIGFLLVFAGSWVEDVIEETILEIFPEHGITIFYVIAVSQFNEFVIILGGLSILLVSIGIVFIRKGMAAMIAAVTVAMTVAMAVAMTVTTTDVGLGIAAVTKAVAAVMGVVGVVTTTVVGWLVIVLVLATATTAAAAGAMAISVAIVVTAVGAGVNAVGDVGVETIPAALALALAATIDGMVIAGYIGWRTYREDPQFAILQRIVIAFASFGGTDFRGANLTDADFSEARVKNARFSNARLTRTCWQNVKHLKFAHVNGTILADRTVRELLVTGDGIKQPFVGKDLQEAYLVSANLNSTDFSGANLHGATLQRANLCDANLTETVALEAEFKGADLTGACVEGWNIDSTTKLDGVYCEYIYLRANHEERRPNSGIFGEGEFSKLFQEVLNTVEFIFNNGIDWQAFLISFDNIREKIQVESEETDIAVQSIENKGDGVFVVKVIASQEIDKEKLHQEFQALYNDQLALQEAKYQALLQGKDNVITLYRQQAIDMKEIVTTMVQKQAVNINIGQALNTPQITQQDSKEVLQQHYQLLSEKVNVLRKDWIIETDSATKFKLEIQIKENESNLKKIEQRLVELETKEDSTKQE